MKQRTLCAPSIRAIRADTSGGISELACASVTLLLGWTLNIQRQQTFQGNDFHELVVYLVLLQGRYLSYQVVSTDNEL